MHSGSDDAFSSTAIKESESKDNWIDFAPEVEGTSLDVDDALSMNFLSELDNGTISSTQRLFRSSF